MIIVLNGTSSAGKSTLAMALQDQLQRPFVVLGIDTFVFALPRRYINRRDLWAEIFRYETIEGRIDRVYPGPLGLQLVRGMHAAVAALAREGIDVVVDHVLLDATWAADLNERLNGLEVLRVGVFCPPEVLDERETGRGDRTVGQARAQLPEVHAHLTYDVEVDTSQLSPEESATVIAARVQDSLWRP